MNGRNMRRLTFAVFITALLSATIARAVPVTFRVTPGIGAAGLGFHYGENTIQLQVDLQDDDPLDPGFGIPDMTAACTLTIDRPTLEISPNMGPRGTIVEANGIGWLTGQTDFVTIYYQQTILWDKRSK